MQSKKLLVTLVTLLAFAAGAGNAAADSWSATVTDAATATSATAPASSNNGQSANQSIGTVQLGQTNVSPATAANAGNVNANAPVSLFGSWGGCGCSHHGEQEAEQSNTASAETETSQSGGNHPGGCGCSWQPAGQSANQSIGTVQLGQTNVSPATAANAGSATAASAVTVVGRSRRTGSGLPGMGVAGLLLATRVGRGQRAAAKRVLAAGRGGGVLPFTGLSLLISGVLGLVVSTSGCLVRKAVSVRSIS